MSPIRSSALLATLVQPAGSRLSVFINAMVRR